MYIYIQYNYKNIHTHTYIYIYVYMGWFPRTNREAYPNNVVKRRMASVFVIWLLVYLPIPPNNDQTGEFGQLGIV